LRDLHLCPQDGKFCPGLVHRITFGAWYLQPLLLSGAALPITNPSSAHLLPIPSPTGSNHSAPMPSLDAAFPLCRSSFIILIITHVVIQLYQQGFLETH
jgi:hypothetical protein